MLVCQLTTSNKLTSNKLTANLTNFKVVLVCPFGLGYRFLKTPEMLAVVR